MNWRLATLFVVTLLSSTFAVAYAERVSERPLRTGETYQATSTGEISLHADTATASCLPSETIAKLDRKLAPTMKKLRSLPQKKAEARVSALLSAVAALKERSNSKDSDCLADFLSGRFSSTLSKTE